MKAPLITASALGDLSPQRALVAATRLGRVDHRTKEPAAEVAARLAAPSTTPSEEE